MMKALVVDDREADLSMLKALLEGMGHEVATAKNGAEALAVLQKEAVDLVISDVLMPVMDGYQLCRECKTEEGLRKIPFVFYTATYTDQKDEEFALGLGAERYIVKPKEPEEFMEIIDGVLMDYMGGLLVPTKAPAVKEEVYLKEYNERLVKKLESNMLSLEEANHRLREEMERHKEYVREVAHRLRNPLQRLMGFLDLLDTEGLTKEQWEVLEEVQTSVRDIEDGIKKLT